MEKTELVGILIRNSVVPSTIILDTFSRNPCLAAEVLPSGIKPEFVKVRLEQI